MNSEELKQLENDLWRSADTLRANSDLKSSEYSTPVLELIFLKFADNRYRRFEKEILKEYTRLKGTRCPCSDALYCPVCIITKSSNSIENDTFLWYSPVCSF